MFQSDMLTRSYHVISSYHLDLLWRPHP